MTGTLGPVTSHDHASILKSSIKQVFSCGAWGDSSRITGRLTRIRVLARGLGQSCPSSNSYRPPRHCRHPLPLKIRFKPEPYFPLAAELAGAAASRSGRSSPEGGNGLTWTLIDSTSTSRLRAAVTAAVTAVAAPLGAGSLLAAARLSSSLNGTPGYPQPPRCRRC